MVFGFGKKKKYEFSCSSVGMNCGFEVKNASSEQEVLEILKVHAKTAHGMKEIPSDVAEKIKQNIKKV
ncbi:DUF1059 domain-containing protein [Sulfolobus acidocaldarius]|uniref:Conserved protein n=4 Tax=Sulfolobus acidocaldarius TaxID=2285 RepID=Q4JBQ7_SULAC|nr:DUF1059 domain-containing protein [Sulfolobus acidocaldarius]AAY79772.1 conserved protein [Sulfolobus acidocaldarius DSM 639]AGE70330.1 hypothetical protein SacN8_01745 [Sulfolobus acidocaldarius N8]AGE72605.1 hypothetical protein SacRon12I_01745 [Sulfolobus acidocaldarius Ron12/I]ALU29271.1 small metal-binding protein [Sulfolobus acidocaldarius]ALU32000.1 small metal-binding protein [Sulfolobus acidocaldarius]